ncbi:hypothetical protein GDO86_011714 [Hymenochirus boettgeri]|uniref:Gasdermin-E n=1 Tax=Hymenochirus boettgeri TaxID=247094 RepID=A0A8T2JH98_9PIPI|nr:hypothetical protein GDO86_011714 [Hymenochirus boettgeri]
MFSKATKNFLKDIDSGGNLISVSNLSDSDKVQLLCVVAKKRRFWCWQKPKYQFSSFTCMLSDVLIDETAIKPVVVESEFVKYEGTFGDVTKGNITTDVGYLQMKASGLESVKSQSSFGTLRKQEVDMQHLMKGVQGRRIHLHHPFVQQLQEYKHDVLCILKEKIVTTQKCVITEHLQTEENFIGNVGLKTKIVKVSVSENGNYVKDENTVLEIPPPTAIAYSVVELYVRRDGTFDFCLLPEKKGGFEKEKTETHQHNKADLNDKLSSIYDWDVVDGTKGVVPGNAPLSCFKKAWEQLPDVHGQELYVLLGEILCDSQAVAQLQAVVEDLCLEDKNYHAALDEINPPQTKQVQSILHLAGHDGSDASKKLLVALHIFTSALNEMSDSALALLSQCCKFQLLPSLFALLHLASDDGLCSTIDPILSDILDQERFAMAQCLFALSNIKLEMKEDAIFAATTEEPGFSPHVLCIVISGLHLLEKKLKL